MAESKTRKEVRDRVERHGSSAALRDHLDANLALADLEDEMEEARAAYRKSGNDKNRDAFKAAKNRFAEARTAQKVIEANDPEHPRQLQQIVVGVSKGKIKNPDGSTTSYGEDD